MEIILIWHHLDCHTNYSCLQSHDQRARPRRTTLTRQKSIFASDRRGRSHSICSVVVAPPQPLRHRFEDRSCCGSHPAFSFFVQCWPSKKLWPIERGGLRVDGTTMVIKSGSRLLLKNHSIEIFMLIGQHPFLSWAQRGDEIGRVSISLSATFINN